MYLFESNLFQGENAECPQSDQGLSYDSISVDTVLKNKNWQFGGMKIPFLPTNLAYLKGKYDLASNSLSSNWYQVFW